MDKDQAVIHIEEVADQCGKGKKHHAHRDKNRAEASKSHRHGILHISRTGDFFCNRSTGSQTHHSGRRTDEERVDENGQHLYKSLLDRMTYISGSGGIRRGTYARFIGKESALYAEHETGSGNAAQNGPEIKSIGKNHAKHLRNKIYMHHNDNHSRRHIDEPHNRHENTGDTEDTSSAAHDAVPYKRAENGTDNPRCDSRIIPAVCRKSGLQIIRGKHIEAAGIGDDEEESEKYAKGAVVHGGFDVISGPAVAVSLAVSSLIDLGKGTFNKRGRSADDGNNPHPENGTRPAKTDCRGNPQNISCTYAGCRGNHERMKGRNRPFILRLFHYKADTFPKHTELHQTRPACKIQPCRR